MRRKASVRAIALLSVLVLGLFILALATSVDNSITGAAIGLISPENPTNELIEEVPNSPVDQNETIEDPIIPEETLNITVPENITDEVITDILENETIIPIENESKEVYFLNIQGNEIESEFEDETYYLDSIIDYIYTDGYGELFIYELEDYFIIDSTELNFSSASFSTTARGDKLYSCEWNQSSCVGEWQFIKDVTRKENFEQEVFAGTYAYRYKHNPELSVAGDLGVAAVINSTHADGMVAYGQSTINTPYYRMWDSGTSNFGVKQTDYPAVGGDTKWVVAEGSPTRDELMVGIIQDTQEIHIATYNGSMWAADFTVSSGVPNSAYRSFDLAYEQTSGDTLIVYENSGANNDIIAYRTWNGTDFSAEQTLSTGIASSTFNWIEMVPKENSDDIMILALSSANDIYAVLWNGTGMATSLSSTITTAASSATELHFGFGWEASSGQGLAVYAAGDLTYRTFDPVGGWGGTENTITTGAVDALRVCGQKGTDGDYIGFIWQDSGNDVSARMWDGSTILSSPPTEDAATEANGANNVPVDCAWYDSTHALFGFVDQNALQIDYVTFTKSNTWSAADLTSASTSGNFASDDIKGLRFKEHPSTGEIMAVALDIAEDLTTIRWDGSAWQTIVASPLETSTEATNAAQEGAQFTYYEYDSPPSITINTPTVGTNYNASDSVMINATVIDNIQVSYVYANITLPNSSVEQVVLLDGNTDTHYNGTFTNTAAAGNYYITVIANDSLNQISTEQTNFTVLYVDTNAPSIALHYPVGGENISSSSVNFNWTTTDDFYPTLTCNLLIDGFANVLNLIATSGTPYNYTVQGFSETTYTWNVTCVDGSGNSNTSDTKTFTIDSTNPSISYETPTESDNAYLDRNLIAINISSSDATSGLSNLTIYLYNASGLVYSNTSTTSPYFVNYTGLPDGTYYFNSTAYDAAGNENSTATRTVILDTSNPTISFASPYTSAGNYSQTYVESNISASDDNLDTITIYLYNSSGLVQSKTLFSFRNN
jgi:hypothetical protein